MQSEKILDIEIQLLIIKYGYNKVYEALTAKRDISINSIEQQLNQLEKPSQKKSKSKPLTVEKITAKFITESPHISTQLHELSLRFQNKTFLPQLKDVRRFIEKKLNKPVVLKDRITSTKQLFELLREMPKHELEELLESTNTDQTDFALLSSQIIGK